MLCMDTNQSLYAHPDLKYDIPTCIIYLHGIWLLVRTIAHDLHASIVVASYALHMHMHPGCKKVRGQSEGKL